MNQLRALNQAGLETSSGKKAQRMRRQIGRLWCAAQAGRRMVWAGEEPGAPAAGHPMLASAWGPAEAQHGEPRGPV